MAVVLVWYNNPRRKAQEPSSEMIRRGQDEIKGFDGWFRVQAS